MRTPAHSRFLDGRYTVIADPTLVRLFKPAPPWVAPKRSAARRATPRTEPEALQVQLVAHVLKLRYECSPLVGQSANSLMALTDLEGLEHANVSRLVDLYYGALDVGLTGEQLRLPPSLNPRVWPEWMQGRSASRTISYRASPSTSAVGRLHAALCRAQTEARDGPAAPVQLDPHLLLEGRQPFRAKWRRLNAQYGPRCSALMASCEDDDDERRIMIGQLQEHFRHELIDPYEGKGGIFGPLRSPPDQLLQEVSALYEVTYQNASGRQAAAATAAAAAGPSSAQHGPGGSRPGGSRAGHGGSGLSFAWAVAGDFLEFIKCSQVQREANVARGAGARETCAKSFLPGQLRALLTRR